MKRFSELEKREHQMNDGDFITVTPLIVLVYTLVIIGLTLLAVYLFSDRNPPSSSFSATSTSRNQNFSAVGENTVTTKGTTASLTEGDVLNDTRENISFAATLLGREFGPGNDLKLSPEELEFVSKNVQLFGYDGVFQHGFTDVGARRNTIDYMFWTTNNAVRDSGDLVSRMIALYGDHFTIETYSGHENSKMWANTSDFQWIILWVNEDGTVTISWIISI